MQADVPEESMATKTDENTEFAKWLRGWIAVIQKNSAAVERTLPEKTGSADREEHSGDAHLFGAKLGVASGRYVG
jgi:hypothetical protein